MLLLIWTRETWKQLDQNSHDNTLLPKNIYLVEYDLFGHCHCWLPYFFVFQLELLLRLFSVVLKTFDPEFLTATPWFWDIVVFFHVVFLFSNFWRCNVVIVFVIITITSYYYREYGEEKLKSFIDNINRMHPTIKFTNKFSWCNGIYCRRCNRDWFTCQTFWQSPIFLSSSWHPFYLEKSIPYSQTFRLNRICSNNELFYKRCNDLDKYLLERGYIEKMVRKEILRARVIPRDTLLEKFNNL